MKINIQSFYTTSGFALLVFLFIALNTLNNALFSGVRLDLTDQGLYSLSKGSKEIIDSIDEPIQMYFFFSDKATKNLPSLRNYSRRVRELLEEYETRAGDNIHLKVIDPEPFSEAEEQAAQLGVQPSQPRAGGEPVYFGLVMVDSLDRHATIPLFDISRETSLEYEISELLHNLLHPEKPTVGVLSTVDLTKGGASSVPNAVQEWAILDYLRSSFEVQMLDQDTVEIPLSIRVLMVVRPSALTNNTLYALEQYLLAGGNALIFDDPYINSLSEDNTYTQDSRFDAMLKAWGVNFDATTFAGDPTLALPVTVSGVSQRHPAFLSIDASGISRDDIVTSQLDSIVVGTAAKLEIATDGEQVVEPIIYTSEQGGAIPVRWYLGQLDAAQLRRLMHRAGPQSALPVGVRISGAVSGVFSAPPSSTSTLSRAHVEKSDNINVIFVADIDTLADQFWVRKRNFLGREFATSISDNGNFVLNALENLTGSSALISIRSRGRFSRPFVVVEEIRRKADDNYRKRSDELERRLRETEQELSKLRAEAQESQDQIQIQREHRRAVARYNAQRAKILRQLRDVRHQLNRDIDSLDANLRFINIAAAPVLLVLLMVFSYRWVGRFISRRRILT